jgi:hypothetical protein
LDPKDPQELLVCLGHLDLEDLVLLDPQDPPDLQDLQLSWAQVGTVSGVYIHPGLILVPRVTYLGGV